MSRIALFGCNRGVWSHTTLRCSGRAMMAAGGPIVRQTHRRRQVGAIAQTKKIGLKSGRFTTISHFSSNRSAIENLAFLQACVNNGIIGIYGPQRTCAVHVPTENERRGMFAVRSIEDGEEILFVPWTACLSRSLTSYSSEDTYVLFARQIWNAWARTDSSFMSLWAHSMPGTHSALPYTDSKLRDCVSWYPALAREMDSYKTWATSQYLQIDWDRENNKTPTLEQFYWAVSLAHSRSFQWQDGNDQWSRLQFMAPIADLFNHSPHGLANAAWSICEAPRPGVSFHATRLIQPGEEVTISYTGDNPHSSDYFYLFYGFASQEELEDVEVFENVEEALEWLRSFLVSRSLRCETSSAVLAEVEAAAALIHVEYAHWRRIGGTGSTGSFWVRSDGTTDPRLRHLFDILLSATADVAAEKATWSLLYASALQERCSQLAEILKAKHDECCKGCSLSTTNCNDARSLLTRKLQTLSRFKA